MDIDAVPSAAGLVVRVGETRIDAAIAIEFKEAIRGLAEGRAGPVILDLSRVNFLDSSGLGAVVAVMKLLGTDRQLQLAGLTPPVAKVFRLTRMDRIFTILDEAPTLKAAG